jgi:glucose dehydrogenase
MKLTWVQAAEAALLLAATAGAATMLLSAIGVGQAWEHDSAADVDGARIANAEREPANWLSYGRTYSEQRFSPLSKIYEPMSYTALTKTLSANQQPAKT